MKSYIVSDKDLKKIEHRVLKELPARRILHSLSCSEILFHLYPKITYKNARAISLLHDIAHHWSGNELRSYIKMHNITLEEGESDKDVLLHAPVDACILRETLPDCPKEWENAIRRHTIPHPDMCELAAALFVADIIEPTRPFISDDEREKVFNMSDNWVRLLYSIEKQGEYLKRNGDDHLPCTKELIEVLKHKTQVF